MPIDSLFERLGTNLHTGLSENEATVSDRDACGVSRDAVQRRLEIAGPNKPTTLLDDECLKSWCTTLAFVIGEWKPRRVDVKRRGQVALA